MKAKFKIDNPFENVNSRETVNEHDANRALFDMKRAYTAAEHADQIKRANIISALIGSSFMRNAKV